MNSTDTFRVADPFQDRHIGPNPSTEPAMLKTVGAKSLDDLISSAIPAQIRFTGEWKTLPQPHTEAAALRHLADLADKNVIARNYIGMGYHASIMPSVIRRCILENPQWYTPYTPYQAEISQGRLEALLNFQTMIADLTRMDMSNASLLDESTAAAEAMTLCHRMLKRGDARHRFLADQHCHPQTLALLKTRAKPLGIEVITGDVHKIDWNQGYFGVLVQYPDTNGSVADYRELCTAAHAVDSLVVVAADLLALALLIPPGEFGADVVVGNSQRFGLPLGYGGPHAGYMACRETYQRQLPGRIVGVSKDRLGNNGMRLSLQTREQHIRRDKATSNICTAQALPAILASMFAVYHGPRGLRQIAMNIHLLAELLAHELRHAGWTLHNAAFFDTLTVSNGPVTAASARQSCEAKLINLRWHDDGRITIALDETTTLGDVADLLEALGAERAIDLAAELGKLRAGAGLGMPRSTPFLQQAIFNSHHSETELMRYMDRLQKKDIGLTDSMIPLGSCTMKLNAATEMTPVTWPGFANIHPFAPQEQTAGYQELCGNLEKWLAEITGFAAVSLQPNSGSQGEYAGLLAIRGYQDSRKESHRDICLIPTSAHGTNPASAVMAGLQVVPVRCDERGNIDVADLERLAVQHKDRLSCLMVTYPSTHGVFEETIKEVCRIVHANGGQVYLDGANMNAMVGLCRPGDIGGDVCHLNLHKTFCIPHGGGGPGMGPIGVAAHLAPFLPGHLDRSSTVGPVSETPYGSGCILPISYAYILMMGAAGLARATKSAILNANYVARVLEPHFPVLYKGANGRVAHECIIDCRGLKAGGTEVEDVAKRLIDFGFHAPTMSWPVAGTLMIEPTESEPKEELDRFCEAMIQIREEARGVASGELDRQDNVLKNAPHTAVEIASSAWAHPYSRESAAFPLPWVRDRKYWSPVARVDNVYGDRNLVCTCEPLENYIDATKA